MDSSSITCSKYKGMQAPRVAVRLCDCWLVYFHPKNVISRFEAFRKRIKNGKWKPRVIKGKKTAII